MNKVYFNIEITVGQRKYWFYQKFKTHGGFMTYQFGVLGLFVRINDYRSKNGEV